MKKCPACNRSYDDSQSFCLMDGAALTVEDETETIVSQSPARRKSKFPLLAALLGFVLLVLVAGGIGIWFLLKSYAPQQNVSVQNKSQPVNNKPSPTISSTPKPSPSPVTETSPKPEESVEESPNQTTDEVTPISWDTSPIGFRVETGQILKFSCPESGKAGAVYGSDIYTLDSSICTAAVHAGVINLEKGGEVTVEIRPGRQIYGSTTRNGIKSTPWGPYNQSFVVR